MIESLDRMPAGRAAVLAALLRAYASEGRVTVRNIADDCSISVSTAHHHLIALRRVGLIAWEPQQQGTLRPLIQARRAS